MARVYVGNLDPRVTARELEDEFRVFGVLRRLVTRPTCGMYCVRLFRFSARAACACGIIWGNIALAHHRNSKTRSRARA